MKNKFSMRLSATQIITFGFIAIILAGACLLSLPIATRGENSVSFVDALFTATTSTCVTGLIIADTYSNWTIFGQIVIITLIQIGGLGFMTIATLVSMAFNRKIGFRERIVMSEAISLSSVSGVVRLTKNIIICTFCIELFGAICLSTRFIPEFGWVSGIYKSIFHSVSAFCNAGIDLMGEKGAFSSLTTYTSDIVVNMVICGLIVVGGLGFTVWEDLFRFRERKKLRLHTKLVLLITSILIVSGTIFIYLFEFTNTDTIGGLGGWQGAMAAFFQSITIRTAGFNTLDLAKMRNESIFLMTIFMVIGGSPGSTAGGIKTTTVGIVILTIISVIRGSSKVQVFDRRIGENQLRRAIAVFVLAIITICTGIILIFVFDELTFREVIFEVASAFGTVGLTLGITTNLSSYSKLVLIVLMYLGRVGVLTAAMAITKRQHMYEEKISCVVETILF